MNDVAIANGEVVLFSRNIFTWVSVGLIDY